MSPTLVRCRRGFGVGDNGANLGIPVGLVNRLARRPFSMTITVTVAAEPVSVILERSELEDATGSAGALDEAIEICTRYDFEN